MGLLVCVPPFGMACISIADRGREKRKKNDDRQEMIIRNKVLRLSVESVLPWLTLVILLTYSYAKFFRPSYGFRLNPDTGLVVFVFDDQPAPTLRENDRIVKIGSITLEEFQADLKRSLFEGYEPGDIVPLTIERGVQTLRIDWVYPSELIGAEIREQLISEWFIAYVFWLAGILTILLVRPKDESWLLMILFNFLTAIWLMAGSGLSGYHLWDSAIVLRVVIWLSLPIYLHLHWVFPRPLGKLPPLLIWIGYGIALCFAIAQIFELLPTGLYSPAFLLAVGGSLILLLMHIWRQPSIRRDFRLLLIVLFFSVAPAVLWQFLGNLYPTAALYGSVGILSLSLLPFAYLYIAFRRRLGDLELRVNRFFTIYLFIVLLAMLGLPLIALAEYNLNSPDKALIVASVAASMTAIVCLWGYPAFERFLEYRLFNIRLPSKRLLELYSTHINTSLSTLELVRVLQEDILPSLLVRQFAFLQYDQGALRILSAMGLRDETLPNEKDVSYLMDQAGHYRSPDLMTGDQPFPWVRLILHLRLGDQLMGFWLFGRRDPDDLYSQQEIPTLISLANLTAIALSNILQTERLTSMYQANINRYEQERLSLARDLHDSILNELAALPIRSDAPVFSSNFHEAYDGISDHLREIIQGLRPSMLSFGLKLALEDYAENLRERNPESVEIQANIQADGDCRYPLMIESNVYRIVQEACENSLRYAHGKHLTISGTLGENQIELRIADDGLGLDPDISLRFNDLLTHRHFGLAGMHERASVIGAELHIVSKPREGTQIQLVWKVKDTI